MALRSMHKRLERQRAYYGANIVAAVVNGYRGRDKASKVWVAEDFMPHFKSVVTTDTHDPDRGAITGSGFKQSLKQTTQRAKERRARRPKAVK